MKEHHAAARLGHLEKSAVVEHAWQEGHTINWSGIRILDEASRNSVLLIKEAVHIRLRSTDGRINRETGLDIPQRWVHAIPSVMSTIVINDAVSPRLVFWGFCNRLVFPDSSTPLFSISELCCLVIRFCSYTCLDVLLLGFT